MLRQWRPDPGRAEAFPCLRTTIFLAARTRSPRVVFKAETIEKERSSIMTTTTIETATSRRIAIAPIRRDFLDRARTEGLDDQGQPVRRLIAEGGEPCRDVLRRAKAGEELILASYSPFSRPGPFKEFGPIYILANPDREEVVMDDLPSAGTSADYLNARFVVRAYTENEEIRDAQLVEAVDFNEVVDALFEVPETAFLHVRFPTYGCFACRIGRA